MGLGSVVAEWAEEDKFSVEDDGPFEGYSVVSQILNELDDPKEKYPPITTKTFMDFCRPSSIGQLDIEQVIKDMIAKTWRTDGIGYQLAMIFRTGHAMHDMMPELYMKDLLGRWVCKRCGAEYGKGDLLVSVPDHCSHCSQKWSNGWEPHFGKFWYREPYFKHKELPFGGHVDGVINTDKFKFILDVKTINDMGFNKVWTSKVPSPGYIAQLHCYMWLSGIHRARILYINKNNSKMFELPIKYDEKVIELIETRIRFLYESVLLGKRAPGYPDMKTLISCPELRNPEIWYGKK